jgi:hypothetical protein
MVWEALGSVLIGLAIAAAGSRWLPARLPSRPLVMISGLAAGLFGGLVTRSAVGPGHTLATLFGALVVSVALLSLLVRPAGRMSRSAAV